MRAELIGRDPSMVACAGFLFGSVRDACRSLISAGHKPSEPLLIYRGDTLELAMRLAQGADVRLVEPVHAPGQAGGTVLAFPTGKRTVEPVCGGGGTPA
jgi:hypothetical protein